LTVPDHCKQEIVAYAKALAAFKRDSNENGVIAALLREHLTETLIPPLLDVGAGSGELAALAFPDLTAYLLDLESCSVPTNALHHRIQGNFLTLDLSAIRPRTIIFCHSLYFLSQDMERLGYQLRESGASTVIVVSNEKGGAIDEIADRLAAKGLTCGAAFDVAVPNAKIQMKIPFSVLVKCNDFRTLSQHFSRILLNCELTDEMLAAVERELRRVTAAPQVEIAEAIYIYCLQDASR
jgi:hypothetical protein